MKLLIAYATKSGASRACAEELATHFDHAELVDLSGEKPRLEGYDMVIAGTGIRIGRAYKPFLRFLKENSSQLLERPLAIYLCNGEPESYEKAVSRNVPAELLAHALCVKSFGGKQPFSRSKTNEWMNLPALEEFAEVIKAHTHSYDAES